MCIKGKKEKEEAKMNGDVPKDAISSVKSSSPDRDEKQNLLPASEQTTPVIVKMSKTPSLKSR